MATDSEVSVGDVYKDKQTGLYVKVSSIFVDGDGKTRARIDQYTDQSCAAHSSAAHTDGYDSERILTVTNLYDRITSGRLQTQ